MFYRCDYTRSGGPNHSHTSSLAQGCYLVAKLCPTLLQPMDCSPQGSSVHGISQARILE